MRIQADNSGPSGMSSTLRGYHSSWIINLLLSPRPCNIRKDRKGKRQAPAQHEYLKQLPGLVLLYTSCWHSRTGVFSGSFLCFIEYCQLGFVATMNVYSHAGNFLMKNGSYRHAFTPSHVLPSAKVTLHLGLMENSFHRWKITHTS